MPNLLVPPKPAPCQVYDRGAIIAWGLQKFPRGYTYNVYWEAGEFSTPPAGALVNAYEAGLKSTSSSVRAGTGTVTVPINTDIYVSVTSVTPGGLESAQSSPLFLSLTNAEHNPPVAVARDDSGQSKTLLINENGQLVTTATGGGGGAGDASAANQLIQIDLAQQQLDCCKDILDKLGGVFGNQAGFAESIPVSILSGSGWMEKVSLVTDDLMPGDFLVQWSYQWNLDSTVRDFEARVELNDTTTIWEHVQEPKDNLGNFQGTGSNQKHATNFAKILNLSGINTIDLDWRSPPGSNIEASIWEARITLWRFV